MKSRALVVSGAFQNYGLPQKPIHSQFVYILTLFSLANWQTLVSALSSAIWAYTLARGHSGGKLRSGPAYPASYFLVSVLRYDPSKRKGMSEFTIAVYGKSIQGTVCL